MDFRQLFISLIVVAFLVPWVSTSFISPADALELQPCEYYADYSITSLKRLSQDEQDEAKISLRSSKDGVETRYLTYAGYHNDGDHEDGCALMVVFAHPDLLLKPEEGGLPSENNFFDASHVCNEPVTINKPVTIDDPVSTPDEVVVVPVITFTQFNRWYFYYDSDGSFHVDLDSLGSVKVQTAFHEFDEIDKEKIIIIRLDPPDFTRDKEPDSPLCLSHTSLDDGDDGGTTTIPTVSDTGDTSDSTIDTLNTDNTEVQVQSTTLINDGTSTDSTEEEPKGLPGWMK